MSVTAPVAPGRLGDAIDPSQLQRYVGELADWLQGRRTELDALDEAARQANNRGATSDIMLSLALWQAVKSRYELLLATWDGGRVGENERRTMSSLIWGRLDTVGTPGGSGLASMNTSLPEACRLADALAGSLRVRLQLSPDADKQTARIATVRATVERLRDQVELEPAATRDAARDRLAALVRRTDDAAQKASRGGDIGGLLGPLESESATFERDMIVGGVKRRRAQALYASVTERLADLRLREAALGKLVAQAVAAVDPAPKYAVPDVAALGPVPNDAAELTAFGARLDQVDRAMQVVQSSYSQALAQRDDLAAAAADLDERAGGVADDLVAGLRAATAAALRRQPTPMRVAAPLVEAYRAALDAQAGADR